MNQFKKWKPFFQHRNNLDFLMQLQRFWFDRKMELLDNCSEITKSIEKRFLMFSKKQNVILKMIRKVEFS